MVASPAWPPLSSSRSPSRPHAGSSSATAADGFDVLGAHAGDEALDLAELTKPDLVLDEFFRTHAASTSAAACGRASLAARGTVVPVILLAENGDPVDRVRAFARGVDDYVSKPFHYEELLARIRAVLRRAALPPVDRIDIAEITIDRPTRRASVSGDRVVLAGKEYELPVEARVGARACVHEGGACCARCGGTGSMGRTRTLIPTRRGCGASCPATAASTSSTSGVGRCGCSD